MATSFEISLSSYLLKISIKILFFKIYKQKIKNNMLTRLSNKLQIIKYTVSGVKYQLISDKFSLITKTKILQDHYNDNWQNGLKIPPGYAFQYLQIYVSNFVFNIDILS